MKIHQLVIFLSVVLGVYTLVNLFLYYQTRPLFSLPTIGTWLKFLFWIMVLSYPFGRTIEALIGGQIPVFLVKTGSMWLAFMLYLTLLFLLFQLSAPLVSWIFNIDIKKDVELRQILTGIVYSVAFVAVLVGYLNAINPKINLIDIKTSKPIPAGGLKIAMVSDIHLGTIIGKKDISRLTERINSQNVDLVVLVGDIFDEDIAPVVNGQMGKMFEHIKSKYGVYAVTGNHEFFGKYQDKIDYLQKHNVKVLNDTAITVANINIVGRYDRQSNYARGQIRKSLPELIENIDKERFILVMDHQPINLNEAVEAGVDMQLSGHTHHGQLWPLNYITKAMYEVSMGYKKKGKTHIYVSPGYGTWGPRVRLGSRPEIAVLMIHN